MDLDEAIANVTEESIKEADAVATPDPKPEPTPEPPKEDAAPPKEEPTPEPEKKVEPEPPEEEDLELSAEQLEAINADPKLRAVYKSVQRGLTKKAQTLAEKTKALDEKAKLADWIEENPDKALEIMAEKRGRRLAPTEDQDKKAEVVDELMGEWTKAFNGNEEAAKTFYPLLRRTIESAYEKQAEPLLAAQAKQAAENDQRTVAANISQFATSIKEKGQPYDDDIAVEMANSMQTLQPAKDIDFQDYLQSLYNDAMYRRVQATNTKAALERLRKAESDTEPVSTTRPAEPGKLAITTDMSENDAIAAAVALAEQESRG
jgi:hypothetical protein